MSCAMSEVRAPRGHSGERVRGDGNVLRCYLAGKILEPFNSQKVTRIRENFVSTTKTRRCGASQPSPIERSNLVRRYSELPKR